MGARASVGKGAIDDPAGEHENRGGTRPHNAEDSTRSGKAEREGKRRCAQRELVAGGGGGENVRNARVSGLRGARVAVCPVNVERKDWALQLPCVAGGHVAYSARALTLQCAGRCLTLLSG